MYEMIGMFDNSRLGKFVFLSMMAGIVLLNLGTVRKKPNAILRTQTDPIAYKDKMEEIKDGVKGAPQPVWTLYSKGSFLSDPPVEASQMAEAAKMLQEKIPVLGEPLPENLDERESPEETGWTEEGTGQDKQPAARDSEDNGPKKEEEW